MGMMIGLDRRRSLVFVGSCVLAVLLLGVIAERWQSARAQQDAAATSADDAKPDTVVKKNLFTHIIISARPIFGPLILLISIALVALIVLLAMDLRMGVSIPPAFVEEFTDTLNKRKFKEAFEMCKEDDSFLARVITSGMGRLQYGLEDAREASR